jgi:hypothetical protein
LDLFLGAEKNDVGQRGLYCITDASRSVGARPLVLPRDRQRRRRARRIRGGCQGFDRAIRLAPQIPQMSGVDGEIAREGSTQGLVCGDQCPQAFVDLAVFTFAAPLDRLHDEQSDAHTDQCDDGQSEQS